jgi:glucosylceramidase
MKSSKLFLIVPLTLFLVRASAQKTIADMGQQDLPQAAVYTTASGSDLRLTYMGTSAFQPATKALESAVSVYVNPAKTFQTMTGIGAAITDASAEVFAALSADKQQALLEAYFDDEKGIGYSLIRTTIHSCDFSSESYTYVQDHDTSLTSFSIQHDLPYRIPFIRQAIAASGLEIPVYASPWSPPAFMKDNNNMLQGGQLLPAFYDAWAQYYIKFIQAYESAGIPIWGLTIQNEPMAIQRWESCIYTAEQERDFLKNHLGPALHEAGMADKKVIFWDHNRDLIYQRAAVMLEDPEAAAYVWGIGFHWYETWAGGAPMFDNLARVQEAYPDKKLIFTEGCVERFDTELLQHWPNAERYGRSMINDFNNGTVAWTDWNILLDQTGGPNHVNNLCFAPVHANVPANELIFTPSYYYIGHFSRFIRPGAKRLSCSTNRSFLLSTSFQNPDGSIATVVMNEGDQPLQYSLFIGETTAIIDIPAHAIQTVLH